MIACFLAFISLNRELDFSTKPPVDEVEEGRSIYRSHSGIDRTLKSDRVVLGRWYDGRVHRPVDTAFWLSPQLVARWLGYLAERDAWSDEVIAKHWNLAAKELGGKLTFIVRLSAFPRLDPFEFGIGAPPKPETIKGVKLRLSFDTSQMHADPGYVWSSGRCLAALAPTPVFVQKEKPEDILGRPFYGLTRFDSLFMDDSETDTPDDEIPNGDFYGAVYICQFPLGNALKSATRLELAVHLSSKDELAHFSIGPTPLAPVKPHEDDN